MVDIKGIHPYDTVEFINDKYESEGVNRGVQGAVVDDFPNSHKLVEVSNQATGETIALVMAKEEDLLLIRAHR